jgi:hypothetical protein
MQKMEWSAPQVTVLSSGREAQGGSDGVSKTAAPDEFIAGGSENFVGDEEVEAAS